MTASTLRIERAETDAQLDTLLAIRNAVDQQPISRATFAARESADIGRLRLIARDGTLAVGAGAVSWTATSREAGEASIRVWVLPDRRGCGIGSRIHDDLLAFALEHGLTKGFGQVRAGDQPSLDFARHRGWQVFGRNQFGLFALEEMDVAAPTELPDGIAISSMAERRDLEPAVYALAALTLPEVPSYAGMPAPSFAAWREEIEEPSYVDSLSLLALDGDQVLGSIQVYDDGDGTAFISMLSVAPAARRRGIARALKLELARRAALAGWRNLETINDGTNDGIRRLNEELGYRYLPEVLLLEASLG